MLLIVIYPLRVSFICCQIGDNSVNNSDVAGGYSSLGTIGSREGVWMLTVKAPIESNV